MGTKVTPETVTNLQLPSAIGQINDNFDLVSDEFDSVVYRDGSLPMTGNLDLNSKRILNLPSAVSASEPVTYGQLASLNTQVGDVAALNQLVVAAGISATAAGVSAASSSTSAIASASNSTSSLNSATAAASSASSASTSASSASTSASSASTSAATASAQSSAATLASATAGAYPNSAASNVPRGLTQASVGAITAGSGGTNGIFTLSWSSGNFSINPTGTFTVAGGVLTSVTITGPGLYIGASPSVPTPSFSASSGLSGAAVALTAQFIVTSGQGYWVQSTGGRQLLRYYNASGTATLDSGVSAVTSLIYSGTASDRDTLAGATLSNGQHFYVTNFNPPREFVWVTSGSKDPFGNIAGSDGWVGIYTQSETKNLGIDFTGTLPAANVASLPTAISDIAALASLKIGGFDARALSSATNPVVDLSWNVNGVRPSSQIVSWGTYPVLLDGGIRHWSPPNWSTSRPIFVVGNSLSDSSDVSTRWSQLYSAARGVTLYTVAKYGSDARMVYRTGSAPLYLTIAGNTLTAASSSPAVITAINGNAPSTDASAHPESWLNQGAGTSNGNCSMPGWVFNGTVARHGTAAIPNDGSVSYTFAQDSGATAIAVSGPVLFIPDITLQMATSDLVIWTGNNYFYSGVPNTYGDYTNPNMWIDMALIVARAQGQRIQILPVLPASDMATTGTGNPYTAMNSANARTEALYPRYFARDTLNRTLLQRLQASGNGSANDNADIAAGFIPRSLRNPGDSLHLNSSGDAIVATFLAEHRAVQALPPAITQSTIFTLQTIGTQIGTGASLSDGASTITRLAPGAV